MTLIAAFAFKRTAFVNLDDLYIHIYPAVIATCDKSKQAGHDANGHTIIYMYIHYTLYISIYMKRYYDDMTQKSQ